MGGGNGNQMPGKGTLRARAICAEPTGEVYRNWFHLHPAGRLACVFCLSWEGVRLGYPE